MKRIINTYLVVLFYIFSFNNEALSSGISEFKPIPEYSCVNHDENVLIVPGDDKLLVNLFDKINHIMALGQGHISILHIGGSHVQAGIFSHRLRMNFRELIGDYTSSKGIIFPFRTMGTNAPKNYYMSTNGSWRNAKCVDRLPELPLGVSGAAIQSCDSSASVSFDLKSCENDLWQYDKLIVLGEYEDKMRYPLLVCGGDTITPDSIEDGAYTFRPPYEASDGCVLFECSENSPVTFRGIITENSYSGLTYHEAGINGASVPAWLRCQYFDKEIKYINPDIVILGVGINDANVSPAKFNVDEFKANYSRLIERIKFVNPNAMFFFITNNDCKLNIRGYRTGYNPNTLKVEQAFIDLARKYNGAVWNLFRVMGGPGSSKEWVNQQLMQNDRIHFNKDGYELLGDLFYNAFVGNFRNIDIE